VGRWLPRITVCLALGAVVNVATAWACALVFDVGAATASELYTLLGPGHHWEVFRWSGGPGTRVLSRSWTGMPPVQYNPGEPEWLIPGWMGVDLPDPDAREDVAQVWEGWGFPMASMSCRSVARTAADGSFTTTPRGVLQVRPPSRPGARGLYVPLIPIWTGFSINTVFYALLVFAASAAARDLSRFVSRRRLVATPA
jgi:hypothetical protein